MAAEHGLPALELWCLLPRGWAAAYRGDVRAGIADICESMDRRRSIGMGAVWPWFFALLAQAQGLAGQVDEGLSSLEEALGWVERNDERLYEAEVHRLKGELLLTRDTPDAPQAEGCFQQALTIFAEAALEVLGTARCDEHGPAMATDKQARRGSRVVGAHLRLVHRRLRYGGSTGSKGSIGGALMMVVRFAPSRIVVR